MPASPVSMNCLLCGGRRFDRIWVKGSWRYLCCRQCTLVHLYPQPTPGQAAGLYEEYLSTDPKAINQWSKMARPVVNRSADLIEKIRIGKPGSLLDIGCGYGFFLSEMGGRGWNVQGLEISPAGRRHARDRLGIAVTNQPLELLARPANGFDVITLFYVIEHLVNPAAMLQSVLHLLKPGGLILLRWPHTTPIVRLLGPFARKLDLYHTPYHLYDFSPGTISALLRKCGFTKVHTTTGGYTLPANPFARLSSFLFGNAGHCLETITHGRILLPGISKTTLAYKP